MVHRQIIVVHTSRSGDDLVHSCSVRYENVLHICRIDVYIYMTIDHLVDRKSIAMHIEHDNW
jgi:hypothetical protein